ncbi:hypothetical protein [Sphingomonas sp.]|uniref:hypothetical protein n=1 Tax=Sphingomonas sp. TaxID=28214 RepID=UPI0017C2A252|nr:hypothetical protein [Sphingomonas sp.]MBA3510732.1 hypothetical protein [Sphingomonas sp.]
MPYREVPISQLRVNRANDRHGELIDETAAVAELFRLYDQRMRNLAIDITEQRAIYDPPLVRSVNREFVVFDGNRRVTCLKLVLEPQRAPNQELQAFFRGLHGMWEGNFPRSLMCQVENDPDVVDAILHRRHTGSQQGIGQIDWNDRAKLNFAERTGTGGGVNVAAEVERFLQSEDRLPEQAIPWSTLTRLLSSEEFRNRVGVSTAGGTLRLTHDRQAVTDALSRITTDLARRNVTLGDLWDNAGKRVYLNELEQQGALPGEEERLPQPEAPEGVPRAPRRRRPRPAPVQTTFIPRDAPHIPWIGAQQRARAIWEELQTLQLHTHPNAIAALVRMLVEMAVEGYVAEHNLEVAEGLSRRVGAVATNLRDRDIIDDAYLDEINRIRRDDALISIPSMQRYIHSPDFAPLENELRTSWTRLERFLVATLSR